jgi:hypothetical protein
MATRKKSSKSAFKQANDQGGGGFSPDEVQVIDLEDLSHDPFISEQLRLCFRNAGASKTVLKLDGLILPIIAEGQIGKIPAFLKHVEKARKEDPLTPLFHMRVLEDKVHPPLEPDVLKQVRAMKVSLALQIAEGGMKYLPTVPDENIRDSDLDVFFISCIEGALQDSDNPQAENEPFIRAMESMVNQGILPEKRIGLIGLKIVSSQEQVNRLIPMLQMNFQRYLNVMFACGGPETQGFQCVVERNPNYRPPSAG